MTQTITSQRPFEANRDAESPNRNLTPITTELDDTDRLCLLYTSDAADD